MRRLVEISLVLVMMGGGMMVTKIFENLRAASSS